MSFDDGGFLFGVFDDKYIDHLFVYIIYNMYHFLSYFFFFTQTIFNYRNRQEGTRSIISFKCLLLFINYFRRRERKKGKNFLIICYCKKKYFKVLFFITQPVFITVYNFASIVQKLTIFFSLLKDIKILTSGTF